MRYRYDDEKRLRFTTVELIEEKIELNKIKKIPANKIVKVKINYDENELKEKIKAACAKWNSVQKYWETDYGTAKKFDLIDRIIADK